MPQPLTYTELTAFMHAERIPLEPWECDAIMAIDDKYQAVEWENATMTKGQKTFKDRLRSRMNKGRK